MVLLTPVLGVSIIRFLAITKNDASLPTAKPGWSFVCLPYTSSRGAPRVKREVHSYKDENPSKIFFFHDPLVEKKTDAGAYAQISDCYVHIWYICYCEVYCGALVGCPDVSKN